MYIGGAANLIIAGRWTIPIAGFSFLDDFIGANGSTIIVVKAIAPRGAATIGRNASDNGRV